MEGGFNGKRCYFGHSSLNYVGHMAGIGCLRTLADKVQQIVDAPSPKTKKQLRSFLELAGYYRRFVPSYTPRSQLLSPICLERGHGID